MADQSIEELATKLSSMLGQKYNLPKTTTAGVRKSTPGLMGAGGTAFNDDLYDADDQEGAPPSEDFMDFVEEEDEEEIDDGVREEEEEEEEEDDDDEDSGMGMEASRDEEESSAEAGFYEHINSPEMRSIARRRGWSDIADGATTSKKTLLGEMRDEDPLDRVEGLTAVTASGKDIGQHVPKITYTLKDAFQKIGGEAVIPVQPAPEDESTSSDDDDEDGEYDRKGRSLKRSRTERDETTQNVVSILKRFGVRPADSVLQQLKEGELALRRDEQRQKRQKKRRRVDPSLGGGGDSVDDMDVTSSERQEREYLKPRYKSSGVPYESFLQTYCPLCGYGDRVNDAIYAPKLSTIREMAEVGVMEGDIGTLAHDLCTVWNEHIYKPMLAEGRRAMRLTYDMCVHHLRKPHRPDPRPMMRRDIEDLTMLIQVVNAKIYSENGLTREGYVDPKMVSASVQLYKTKYFISAKRPENMAFYNASFNFNERAAGGLINVYQKVHYGARRNTKGAKR